MRRVLAAALAAAVVVACNGSFHFDPVDGGAAAQCASDRDCLLPSLHCDTLSGSCVECTSDAQCAGDADRCDVALHVCVQCGVDADCSSGQVCAPSSRTCVTTCTDGGGCPGDFPVCTPGGVCSQCASSADCTDVEGRPTCDLASGRCVACASDAACPAERPRCAPGGTCVQCLQSSDCPVEAPACDPAARACVSP